MTRETLTQCWIFAGTRYGPGEADLPDEVHAALASKGAFPAASAAATAATGPGPQLPQGAQLPPADDPIATAVGAESAAALRAAGYGSVAAIMASDDATLLDVPTIGPARLEKLRALPADPGTGPGE